MSIRTITVSLLALTAGVVVLAVLPVIGFYFAPILR